MAVTVLEEIAAERQRQIAKGFDATHDDAHDREELRLAALAYAARGSAHGDTSIFAGIGLAPLHAKRNAGWVGAGGLFWPFNEEFPFHSTRRERLIIATALLVAEIERLDRALARVTEATSG